MARKGKARPNAATPGAAAPGGASHGASGPAPGPVAKRAAGRAPAPRQVTRRQAMKYGLAGAGVLAAGGAFWQLLGKRWLAGPRPNIVLIVVDTLRADHLGCYGYGRAGISPRIDALARESWLFKRAVSSAPWTLPSVGSLLTGQYPSVLGIREGVAPLDPRFPLLPAMLRERGYASHAIVSVDMLTGRLGFARGFDQYDDENYFGRDGVTSPTVARKAASFLRGAPKQPFFLLAHTFDPHFNWILHDEYNYVSSYTGHLTSNYPIEQIWAELDSLTDADVRYLVDLYDSEISFTDHYVGEILDELERAGLYDDSLIILAADHGEEFRERGWIGHSIHVHYELVRVPLLIKVPGGGPRVVEDAVGLIDLAPTILKYAGVEAPANLEGQAIDLSPGAAVAPHPLFSETFHQQINRPGPKQPVAFVGVELGRRKLIVDGVTGEHLAYDLAVDPEERQDVYRAGSAQDQPLQELVTRWLTHVAGKRGRNPATDGTKLLTPEQMKRLRSLGYLR